MTLSPRTLAEVRHLIVDIDGVLWHGKVLLPGVVDLFRFLDEHEIRHVLATNNSARPASDIIARLADSGIALRDNQILTSAQATAMFLPRILARGSRVLVVGGKGLGDELVRAGYSIVESEADAVVAGLDPGLSYDKLQRATREIRRGAKFIGTNADRTFPGSDGLAPGAGSILAAIQAATDVEPIVVGKPERAMFDVAMEIMAASPPTTAMLGDRLDTDIAGAQRSGLYTILVLTGVTNADVLAGSSIKPDLVFSGLPQLLTEWRKSVKTY